MHTNLFITQSYQSQKKNQHSEQHHFFFFFFFFSVFFWAEQLQLVAIQLYNQFKKKKKKQKGVTRHKRMQGAKILSPGDLVTTKLSEMNT
jgi:hypothetical protein